MTVKRGPLSLLFCDVQNEENSFFKIVQVPKSKGIGFDIFDELVGSFQLGIGIRTFKGIDDVSFVFQKGFEDC